MSNKFKKLASIIGAVAPKLGSVVGAFVPGVSVGGDIIGAIASKFGVETSDPDKLIDAIAQDANASLKFKELEIEKDVELNRILANKVVALEQETTKQAAEVNQTMRAELVSTSKFKSWWRPFNGYILGINSFIFTVFILILANKGISEDNAKALTMIPNLITAYAMITTPLCAVVGVSAHSRGREKLAKMGIEKPGILESFGATLFKK